MNCFGGEVWRQPCYSQAEGKKHGGNFLLLCLGDPKAFCSVEEGREDDDVDQPYSVQCGERHIMENSNSALQFFQNDRPGPLFIQVLRKRMTQVEHMVYNWARRVGDGASSL